MNRRSLLPQSKVVRDKFKVKSTVRKSLSIPENARKKRHYIEKKKQEDEDDIKSSSSSWEERATSSSSSSLSWIDYLPSDTYHSGSEESSTSASSSVSDHSIIEDTRSRATNFAEDFEDIVHTVDGYLNLDGAKDLKGPKLRTATSLDASLTMKEKYPNRMSKSQSKVTSTPLRGSTSRISIDIGSEISEILPTNQESNVKPTNNKGPEVDLSPEPLEMRLLSKISEPEEPAPPILDDSVTVKLNLRDFSAENNACEIEQQPKDSPHQVLFVSGHEKKNFNFLKKKSNEKTLFHGSIFSIAADQAPRRQKFSSSEKIHNSQKNGKQKKISEPAKPPPPFIEDTTEEFIPNASGITTSTMKECPSKMSKFQPKSTSTLLHGSKSRISIDIGGENSKVTSISQEMNVEPSNSKGTQRPKEQPPPSSSIEETLTEKFSGKSTTFEKKQSATNYEFQDFGDIQPVSKYEKESFKILDTKPIEYSSSNISINLKNKKKKLENTVPTCPIFDLFQMNRNTCLKELLLKQKPFKHRKRTANVDVCPLEIVQVSGTGLRQIQLVSSK